MSNRQLGLSLFAAAFAALVVFSGCGPKDAHAPQVAGQNSSASLRYFPRQNTELNDVLMFMLKKGASREQVATVLKNSKLLDRAKGELAPMVRKRNEYKDRFAKVKYKGKDDQPDETSVDIVEYPRLLKALPGKQKQLTKAEKELKEVQDKMTAAQAKVEELMRQQPPTDDQAKQVGELQKQIAKLTLQSQERAKKAEVLQAEVVLVQKQQKAIADAGLEPLVEEWNAHQDLLAKKRAEVDDFTLPINDSTWLFNSSPMRFTFTFTREGLTADIHNWDLSKIDDPEIAEVGVPSDYSTEGYKPRIKNVAYEPMGGIFTFEVYTPKSVYWYRIARTKYNREGDGRLYFKGEILRCTVENGYGWPVIEYVRDIVRCGVNTEGAPVGSIDQVGTPVIRRGAANFVDKDDLK